MNQHSNNIFMFSKILHNFFTSVSFLIQRNLDFICRNRQQVHTTELTTAYRFILSDIQYLKIDFFNSSILLYWNQIGWKTRAVQGLQKKIILIKTKHRVYQSNVERIFGRMKTKSDISTKFNCPIEPNLRFCNSIPYSDQVKLNQRHEVILPIRILKQLPGIGFTAIFFSTDCNFLSSVPGVWWTT